ncbi:hypothetical protein BJ684DRAFT_16382 [Piptocephalis cylindrospora]|uniref:Uncharacterized protein n=1 Tax=Piptocephalis cylindrospora TaxID=1907219 RepID=A0A4P9Y2V3_9FUNG|nr:hypothetical protein BJ684DRAFT_16382 [Piptocephalis cylindrospora]|eukprot:RKP13197.1 hypothetical protein BJ684DRAFT_16382 [Piptocephalis cylindrospora]
MTKPYPFMNGMLIVIDGPKKWTIVDEWTYEMQYVVRPLGPGDEGPMVLINGVTNTPIWDMSSPIMHDKGDEEKKYVDILSLPEDSPRTCIRLYQTSDEAFRWEMTWSSEQVFRWKKPAFSAHLRCVDTRDPTNLLAVYEPVVDENLPEYIPIKGTPLGWIRSCVLEPLAPKPLTDDPGFLAASMVLLAISRNDRL